MVDWYVVPKALHDRLRKFQHEILEMLQAGRPKETKEYFGIAWDDLSEHARYVAQGLQVFVDHCQKSGITEEQIIGTIYTLGFLTGVRFAIEEDHEPEN